MGLSLRFRPFLYATLAYLLLAVQPAAAAQISIAWDANTETDIAGYVVEFGPAAAPFAQSVDVGNVTAWTLTNALPGSTYSFRVVAYNTNGERSDASLVVSTSTVTPGGPTLTVDRTALRFGMLSSSARPITAAQTIRLTQAGAGPATWTVSSNVPWLQFSPASGSGSGSFTVTVVPGAAPSSTASAVISVIADGTSNVIDPIPVSLTTIASTAGQPPIGAVDTPADNTTGVTGSMAITGWALDDVGVTRVRIYRDAVAGEPAGLKFVGDATQVEDARPDVANLFANYPASYRGGWGYLALTNMLPGGGNGTYRFSAYAEDLDGHSRLLGTRTVSCSNATATDPFGAIDTPAPGETVSGYYTSFGWVMSRGPRRADVPGGGAVTVLIDGIPVGSPAGWSARPDLVSAFPSAQYPGVSSALAVFAFDTTAMANGMHTMAWVVTDNLGVTQGVGSRFFRVFNGASAPAVAAAPAISAAADSVASRSADGGLSAEIAAAKVDRSGLAGRRGYSLDTPFRHYGADATGRVVVQSEELDRIELLTTGADAGYLLAGSDVRALPGGSNLDSSGRFTWQPGPGFVGRYDLAFVHREGARLFRQDVTIVLNPKGSNRVGPQVIVDITTPFVAGWAVDLDSTVGTGIEAIHVWAYPVTASGHGTPIFVDVAAYGGARPDVAAVYGDQFLNSGYGIVIRTLPPGTYDLALFPWSTAKGDFLDAHLTRIVVR
jgi:hypothetical protein